jgi:hypothetical protein
VHIDFIGCAAEARKPPQEDLHWITQTTARLERPLL